MLGLSASGEGRGVDLSPTHPAAVVSAALLLLDTLLCCKATLPHWKADAEHASAAAITSKRRAMTTTTRCSRKDTDLSSPPLSRSRPRGKPLRRRCEGSGSCRRG